MPEAEGRSADAGLFQRLAPAGRRLLEGFPSLTPIQRDAIPRILDGRNVLVVARTASGKTEAVLAPILTLARKGKWTGRPAVLYVAPTRALVSDLHRRIASRLAGLVDVGRRTGEYREPDRDLLFTTPESLDSMLARGGSGEGKGRSGSQGHALSGVRAIVLDEVHQLAENARGAQLQVLLGRLEEVTGAPLLRIGLSATVASPEALARRFLGEDAVVSLTGGHRTLNVRLRNGYGEMPRHGDGIDPLADEILRIARGPGGARGMASMLLAEQRETGRLKALVFVASRARCDELSTAPGLR